MSRDVSCRHHRQRDKSLFALREQGCFRYEMKGDDKLDVRSA